jgi:predicted esterase
MLFSHLRFKLGGMKIIYLFTLALFIVSCGGGSGDASTNNPTPNAPNAPGVFSHKLRQTTGANLDYLEFVPSQQTQDAPLIIFHHGSGATGTNNLSHVECCGLPNPIINGAYDRSHPFVILAPQRRSGLDTNALDEFLDYALANYDVDPDRVFFIGWSQGGNVAARYAVTHPEKVKGLVVLAGGFFQGVPANVCNAGELPIWGFSGADDNPFITQTTRDTAEAFQNCGNSALYTRFTDADHWEASVWPFLVDQNNRFDGDDPYNFDVFDWMLSL